MEKKKEQLLLIEPQNELKFYGPFNTHVTSRMRLTNPTEKVILFKIKTTAPKKYCVRPNCGTLNARDSIEISIVLQPLNYDPFEKNRHKFMVQSVVAPRGVEEFGSIEQIWKEVNPQDLMDSKLKCVFEAVADNLAESDLASSNAVTSTRQETQTFAATSEGASPFKHGASGDDSSTITTTDTAKAAAELRQLREDESQLRQENLMLKEQVLRLKLALDEVDDNSAKGGSNVWSGGNAPSYQPQNAYAPPNLPFPAYLIISLLVGILCILFGKFVL
ncbi:vesicle-associated membrane protein-associated protein B/C-like [Phlebotomus argentipes]|uniref:vesicle-associated membrane protein-associated protein B/C-like n=1 Tax=Phlebotomus argentipes TaxID=94469 RepID=UPI0028932788|nr:vesicle-associated membrane protein-associated protein B/C-like [Phlebotomus argentipes]